MVTGIVGGACLEQAGLQDSPSLRCPPISQEQLLCLFCQLSQSVPDCGHALPDILCGRLIWQPSRSHGRQKPCRRGACMLWAAKPRCAGPASGALLATAFAGACEAELLTQLHCPSALTRHPMSHCIMSPYIIQRGQGFCCTWRAFSNRQGETKLIDGSTREELMGSATRKDGSRCSRREGLQGV